MSAACSINQKKWLSLQLHIKEYIIDEEYPQFLYYCTH